MSRTIHNFLSAAAMLASVVFADTNSAAQEIVTEATPFRTPVEILRPVDRYNRYSSLHVEWVCRSGYNQATISNWDANGLRLQDTGWHSVPDKGTCESSKEVGHTVDTPGKPGELVVKGLYPGIYTVKMVLKNNAGDTISGEKTYDVVPNLDLAFGGGSGGVWSAARGDWGNITNSTFGARADTRGARALSYQVGEVYTEQIAEKGKFTDFHVYSYQAMMRLGCDAGCRAGLALTVKCEAGMGNTCTHFDHMDFLFSPDNKLTIEAVSEWNNGRGLTKDRRAVVDISDKVDVRGFFAVRVDFRINTGAAVVFINDAKVFCGFLGATLTHNDGYAGFIYEGSKAGDYFEASSVLVRPSVWEPIGNFCKYPIE